MSKRKKTFLILAAAAVVAAGLSGVGFYRAISGAVHQWQCTQNLAAIHLALNRYLEDHDGVWPQGPAPNESDWEEFWLTTLGPYGIEKSQWVCPSPSIAKTVGRSAQHLHYIPTMFDAEPWIALRWTNQPWIIERINTHGRGPLICFPDGSIVDYATVKKRQID